MQARRLTTRREIVDAAWQNARANGLAAVTLREVAAAVGMRAPSLYSHFSSKNAIYDAMFEQAWTEFFAVVQDAVARAPSSPRLLLRSAAHMFFDFATADPARYQLMNQRTVPGFAPGEDAYRPALAVMDQLRSSLAGIGISHQEDIDLFTALLTGLVDQQLANEPGGTRWRRLLDRAVVMYADALHIPLDPDDPEPPPGGPDEHH